MVRFASSYNQNFSSEHYQTPSGKIAYGENTSPAMSRSLLYRASYHQYAFAPVRKAVISLRLFVYVIICIRSSLPLFAGKWENSEKVQGVRQKQACYSSFSEIERIAIFGEFHIGELACKNIPKEVLTLP